MSKFNLDAITKHYKASKWEWAREDTIDNGIRFLCGRPLVPVRDSIFGLSYLLWSGHPGINLKPFGPKADKQRAQIIVLVSLLNQVEITDDDVDISQVEITDDIIESTVKYVTFRTDRYPKPKPIDVRDLRAYLPVFAEAAIAVLKNEGVEKHFPGVVADVCYNIKQIQVWRCAALRLKR